MPVDTRTAERRDLHFATLAEALDDARSLAGGRIRTTGNKSPEELVAHLATSIQENINGVDAAIFPLPMRLIGRVAGGPIGRYFARSPMRPGFNPPESMTAVFYPTDYGDLTAVLDDYAAAIRRLHQTDTLPRHPIFGTFTPETAEQFHCRHAELHLSFLHPV